MCRAAETKPTTEQSTQAKPDSFHHEQPVHTPDTKDGVDAQITLEKVANEFDDCLAIEDVSDEHTDPITVAFDPCLTNLAHFHHDMEFDQLCCSEFTCGRKLRQGINGDIFKYKWCIGQKHEDVAVKKLRNGTIAKVHGRETNERAIHLGKSRNAPSSEDALTEIALMSHLSKQQDLSRFVLKMHGVFCDSQNNFTWLVTEFADGGELFDVACGGGTSQVQLQAYMSQLLQAVDYLHRHNIGHRDISLENVLLKDGTCKLMDFGMAVASRSTCGTPLRYFRPVGKSFYRAPECYVPHRASISVTPPSNAAPGDIVMVSVDGCLCEVRLPESAQSSVCCMADVWGYEAEPADMFALGICMFILAFQCPAWQEATLSNQFFAYVHNDQEQGLESMLKLWKKKSLCPEAMLLLTSLLQINPRKRLLAADCLQTPWLAEHLENVTNLKGLS